MTENYTAEQRKILRDLSKYIWWQTPEETLENSRRLIAQILNIGTLEDLIILFNNFHKDDISESLVRAEPGDFNEKSWYFWHIYLLKRDYKDIPPLPQRGFYKDAGRRPPKISPWG
jgi:hypothetical protein